MRLSGQPHGDGVSSQVFRNTVVSHDPSSEGDFISAIGAVIRDAALHVRPMTLGEERVELFSRGHVEGRIRYVFIRDVK
jgi:hypothetical protein